MLLSMAPISAMATEENVKYTVSADKSSVNAGEKVIVTFGISGVGNGIDGYATMLLQITFPEDLFVYNVATKTSLSGMANVTYGAEEKKWACTLDSEATSNIQTTGTILTASFTAKTTAGSGEFGISILQCKNLNNDNLTTSVTPATVSVNIDPVSPGVTLDKETLSLEKGGAAGTITATLSPANSNATVEWSVPDETLFSATSSDTKTLTLTPADAESGTTTVSATVWNSARTASFTDTCEVTVSGGSNATVSISPTSTTYRVDDVLEATITSAEEYDTATYQWYRQQGEDTGVAIESATSQTYTITSNDVGKKLYVEVCLSKASIPFNDNPRVSDVIGPIEKKTQAAPTVATTTVTATQVTLTATDGGKVGAVEYGYAEGTSVTAPTATQTSATISGLTENTAYTFFARYAGDASTEASPWGSVNATTLYESRTVTVTKSPDAAAIAVVASTTTNVHTGDSVTVTTTNASPTNYKFAGWVCTPTSLTAKSETTIENGNKLTFKMPKANVEILAKYLTIESVTAPQACAGTITDAGYPGISYTAVAGQRYVITTDPTAPTEEAQYGESVTTGGTVVATFSNANNDYFNKTYYVHTYKPASNDSTYYKSVATSSDAITTPHLYKWEFTSESATFFARLNSDTTTPASQVVTVTNVGTGTLTDVSVTITGSDATNTNAFSINPALSATTINPSQSVTFTITPSSVRTKEAEYVATATVAAKQNGVTEMASKEIGLTYTVADRIAVHVDVDYAATSVYDGTAKPVAITGFILPGMVGGMLTTTDLAVIYTAGGVTSTNAPKTAGSYTANVIVTGDKAADYAVTSPTNITFAITARPLVIKGLAVTDKVYDGTTTATITSAGYRLVGTPTEASGIVSGETVTATIPAAGMFVDKNAGDGKSVTFTDITLTGTNAANYTLEQPTLTGKITRKPITAVVTATDKVYDGTASASIQIAFESGGRIGEDAITIATASDAAFEASNGVAAKDVGTNKPVGIGTISLTGDGASNYTFSQPSKPHATITQLERNVTITNAPAQTYGAVMTYPTASYAPVGGDAAVVSVLYKASGTDDSYSAAAPTNAGTYLLSAQINDPNYKFGTLTNTPKPVTFVINKATPTSSSPKEMGVKNARTEDNEYVLSGFGIAVTGTFGIKAYTTANGILTSTDGSAPHVVDNSKVMFKIVPGATTTDADSITLIFTPTDSKNYNSLELVLNVKRTTESATSSIINFPTSVNLGDDLVLTNTKFKVDYTDHADVEALLSACTTWTDYDKGATGSDAISSKTYKATYTDVAGNKWSASFTFTVNDVVTAIEVTSPTQVIYKLGATEFNFAGGSYKKIMKSEIADTDPTQITQAMCTVNGSPLTTAILNKIGTHTVSVTDASSLKSDSFTITVKAAKQDNITTSPTNDNPGVTNVAATFTDSSGNTVTPSNVSLEITAASNSDASLTNALKAKLGSSMRDNTLTTMHLTLKTGGSAVAGMSGKVRVRLPVPAGAQSSDTFAVVIMDAAGNATTVVPTRVGNFLEFELTSNNVDIAIASRPYQGGTGFNYYITYTYEDWLRDNQYDQMAPPSGLEPDVKQNGYDKYTNDVITAYGNQQSSFWDVVRGSIKNAPAGTVIRADAKTFDQMPADIMNLVRANSVTLVLGWAWGKDITITPNNALVPEADRVYYPLSFLVTALSAATAATAASVLLVPQTGDALEVLSMTPAACGMLDGSKPSVGNAVAALDIAVDEAATAQFPYLPVALGALAAALLLAGLAIGRRRRKDAK